MVYAGEFLDETGLLGAGPSPYQKGAAMTGADDGGEGQNTTTMKNNKRPSSLLDRTTWPVPQKTLSDAMAQLGRVQEPKGRYVAVEDGVNAGGETCGKT